MSDADPGVLEDLTRRDVLKTGGLAATLLGVGAGSSYLQSFDVDAAGPELPTGTVPTACWTGKMDCAALARTVGDRVVKYEGHPDEPRTGGTLCPKGQAQIAQVYDPYRVKAPLKRVNEKGVHGEWEEIGWDQALQEIASEFRTYLEDDPKRFIFQVGRKKSPEWHEDSFVAALKDRYGSIEKYGHGATCSDSGYRAQEMMFGTHGVTETDFEHCDYLIAWGFSTQAGGAHLCNITWPRQLAAARERGMKVVALDPQRRNMGAYVDEWLPIKPGTDMAFFNALNHVLIREGYIDETYLTTATNAPCLLDADGHVLRSEDAGDAAEEWKWPTGELVYDEASDAIVPHEDADRPALTGTYDVDGGTAKPAFQVYVEHVEQYTPAWAADVTGIDADTIERIAIEWGEHAKIGSTTTLNGHELPYRPVGTHGYHVAQQELGLPATMAQYHTSMLVGAIDVVGSTRPRKAKYDHPKDYRADFRSLAYHPENITDKPAGPDLGGSKYHPISSGGYSQIHVSLTNPDQYELPYPPEDMAMIVQMANPVMSAPQTDTVIESMRQLGFVVVVDPFLSETADIAGDYVLPAATADKLEGPTGGWSGYADISHIRFPVMDSLWQSRPDGEIYIDLAKEIDAETEYVADLNDELGLEDTEFAFDPDSGTGNSAAAFLEDGLDRWAKAKGKDLDWFRDGNVLTSEWTVGDGNRYAYLWGGENSPYGNVKHDFYSEVLLRIGERVDELGLDTNEYPYARDYNGFPTWRDPTMWQSPDEYDLTLISHHQIEHKQSRTATNRLLNEIAPKSHVRMNPATADERGIEDGDTVVVESHNAMTGNTNRVEGEVMLLEGIRPDTVDIPAHHGNWKDLVTEKLDEGVSSNKLFQSGPGYIGIDNGQSFHVQVRVSPKGGGD